MSIHPAKVIPIIIVGKWNIHRAILILFDKWHVPDEAKEFCRREGGEEEELSVKPDLSFIDDSYE